VATDVAIANALQLEALCDILVNSAVYKSSYLLTWGRPTSRQLLSVLITTPIYHPESRSTYPFHCCLIALLLRYVTFSGVVECRGGTPFPQIFFGEHRSLKRYQDKGNGDTVAFHQGLQRNAKPMIKVNSSCIKVKYLSCIDTGTV